MSSGACAYARIRAALDSRANDGAWPDWCKKWCKMVHGFAEKSRRVESGRQRRVSRGWKVESGEQRDEHEARIIFLEI